LKTSDFSFELPERLIAQYPPEQRGQSRLMLLDRLTGKQSHRMVVDLPEILSGPELRGADGSLPLLVFNNSKVRKARLVGVSLDSGAKVEFLLLEKQGSGGAATPHWGVGSREERGKSPPSLQPDGLPLPPSAGDTPATPPSSLSLPHSPLPTPHSLLWKTLVKHAKRRKPGSRYAFYDTAGTEIALAEIVGSEDAAQSGNEFRFLAFDREIDDAWLDRYGHIPLPPYIKRQDAPTDVDRYQTVYAATTGSAAAPTAGLHFTRELLDQVAAAGIETAFITLHVGLGTFLPVRSTNIEDHVMHSESFTIDEQTATKIESAKAQGRKIIAVGTTTARTLESAWATPDFYYQLPTTNYQLLTGTTSIFIYPGYQFKIVDALFTNFHTPESTLLMLVSAFAGRELILESYAKAIGEGYRFFSYGDAMLIV
jgi:S-adenosylmethionine:tRNA ribosyltransferase-isomerase